MANYRPRLTFEPKAAHHVHIVGRPTVNLVKPLLIFKDTWGYFQPFLRHQNKETCRHLHKFNVSMACRNVQSRHFHLVTELDHLFFSISFGYKGKPQERDQTQQQKCTTQGQYARGFRQKIVPLYKKLHIMFTLYGRLMATPVPVDI